jgi:hypothetical protein
MKTARYWKEVLRRGVQSFYKQGKIYSFWVRKLSHFSVYKTDVGAVSASLVRDAIRSLAKRINAEVVEVIKDEMQRERQVVIGLKTCEVPNGIGFDVQNQTLTVIGDSWGVEQQFNDLKTLAVNYVKAYKCAVQARNIVPNAQITTKIQGRNVVLEVAY